MTNAINKYFKIAYKRHNAILAILLLWSIFVALESSKAFAIFSVIVLWILWSTNSLKININTIKLQNIADERLRTKMMEEFFVFFFVVDFSTGLIITSDGKIEKLVHTSIKKPFYDFYKLGLLDDMATEDLTLMFQKKQHFKRTYRVRKDYEKYLDILHVYTIIDPSSSLGSVGLCVVCVGQKL